MNKKSPRTMKLIRIPVKIFLFQKNLKMLQKNPFKKNRYKLTSIGKKKQNRFLKNKESTILWKQPSIQNSTKDWFQTNILRRLLLMTHVFTVVGLPRKAIYTIVRVNNRSIFMIQLILINGPWKVKFMLKEYHGQSPIWMSLQMSSFLCIALSTLM